MKEYKVDTGSNVSWHNTLEDAIDVYNEWIQFYNKNMNIYGTKTITLSIDNEIVYLTELESPINTTLEYKTKVII